MLFLLLLQAAATQPADIELNIRATAHSVEIERKGEARLEVRAGPDGGSIVQAEVRPAAGGAARLQNVDVNIRAEARISGAQQNPVGDATSGPD